MGEPADEKHDHRDGYDGLVCKAVVLVDPEERLHAKDNLSDPRHINCLNKVVL